MFFKIRHARKKSIVLSENGLPSYHKKNKNKNKKSLDLGPPTGFSLGEPNE